MKRWLVSLGLCLTLAAGCAAPRAGEPLTKTVGGPGEDDQLEFWHQLNDRKLTSNDDALHGLIILFDGNDMCTDYQQRVMRAKKLHLVTGGFNSQADAAVERGDVAYAIVGGLHMRGGWALSILGNNPRYALRELMYKGLFPRSSPEQLLSGADFVGIIGKIEDYQAGHPEYTPATKLNVEQVPTTQALP